MATAQETMTHAGAPVPLAIDPWAISASVMTPIVFCASLVPCARDIRDAEPICPIRKPGMRTRSDTPELIRSTSIVAAAATNPAMTGDSIAGSTTFDTTPCHWTPEAPADAIVAPTTPPINACEELDGTPRYQVSKFHVMPPTSPANTTVRVTRSVLTNPLAMVAATLKDRKAPTRLSSPDSATATFGGSAPDAMEVAIALPVSWKP